MYNIEYMMKWLYGPQKLNKMPGVKYKTMQGQEERHARTKIMDKQKESNVLSFNTANLCKN